MTTSKWSKFSLLLWKNWMLQWRHKFQTVVEILVPVLFAALLVLIRGLTDPRYYTTNTTYEAVPIDTFEYKHYITEPIDWELVYAPKTPFLDQLMQKSAESLNCTFIGLNDVNDLDTYLIQQNSLVGILFDKSYASETTLPNKLDFSLKFPSELRSLDRLNPLLYNWVTNLQFELFQFDGPRDKNYQTGGFIPGYVYEGFVQVQNMISRTFIEQKTGQTVPPVILQRFPYPTYIEDFIITALESILALLILLSFIYSCINTVKFITTEKERQLKETMKIMGLPGWLHWAAWFTKTMLLFTLSITLMVIMFKATGGDVSVFTYTNFSILWVFLFLYSACTVTFCFMVSSFFTNANTAAACTGLIFFIFYAPFTFTAQNYQLLSLSSIMGVSLFSNTAMAYGFQMILRWEGAGVGLQWNNLFSTVTADDSLTAGHMFLMLIVDSLIYLLITLYVEKIKPGDFGVPEKWYFPITKKFWLGADDKDTDFNPQINLADSENFEADPVGMKAGVQISGLRKVYGNKKVAVEGLTLNMFEDQITVLLGHNGAGKTTTMSMLTGMFPPTSGTALVNGKDICQDIEGVRNSLGLCPQHNILFDELTVREHIVFYSRLKGLEKKEIEAEVQKYVKILELEPKIDSQSQTLSGGMKRKLSVGVALCGGSKVVLCDEPTSGMDPAARRALWDLLQAEKKGRTILLSTHFMDEADILGDRIAIMAEGDLKCSGSSYFLKKKFGVGYHLICVKGEKCNSNNVTALLTKYVPDVVVESDIGSELSYQLPEKYSKVFQNMFRELEARSAELGIQSYGISLTTLEEVFMKVGTDRNASKNVSTEQNGFKDLNGMTTTDLTEIPLLKGKELRSNQVLAMFKKKYWSFLRSWLLFTIQLIIPVAFTILTIIVARLFDTSASLPKLDLTLNNFKDTVTIIETHESVTPNSFENNIAEEYKKYITGLPDSNSLDATTDDMQNHWLGLAKNFLSRLNSQYIVGATVALDGITAWFNNQPYHGIPIAVNTVYNAVLRAAGCVDCEITVANYPLPYTIESRMRMLQAGNNMGFQLAINMGFAMAFVSSFYIIFYVKERVSRAKLLQFVSGVNVVIFWLTALVWDFLTYLVTALVLIITLAVFQEDGFATFDELGRSFLLLVFFGCAMLPINYIMSLLFTIPSTGFTKMTMINIFSGIALFMVTFVMNAISDSTRATGKILNNIFMLFPHYALSHGMSNLNMVNVVKQSCTTTAIATRLACEDTDGYFSWEGGITKNLVYMALVSIVGMGFLIMIELRIFEGLFYKGKNLIMGQIPESEDGFVDEDVKAEKDRVNNMENFEIASNNLVMQKMTKFYGKFQAVNQISVAVAPSTCFGLLGVNGAGKTSTFKMLTGDESVTQGDAWVLGKSIKNDMDLVHQNIGYCPQFDALIDDLTGRETLIMFSLLRGIPYAKIKTLSNDLAVQLNFKQHIDKKVKEYSGGNKRKLSTAVALIGNPSVVYLDEPTTGMDPGAKRQLWDMVCKVRNSGKSIVLTSHSMEECEALCTRLAIMVNGEFKCLGSTQHLKNKFSKGYILTVRIGICERMTGESMKITDYVKRNFPDAYLKEEYQSILTYYLPNTSGLLWSNMFGIMENARQTVNIEDYSLSQTSLEQVFLSFTKYQKDDNKH